MKHEQLYIEQQDTEDNLFTILQSKSLEEL